MSYTTYLAHHGIKGQKWGVRRFQNYDGTRIKNESTQKIKIPKGPYYKWGKERGIRVYDRTKAGNKLFEVMHSTASDVINKLNEDGQMTKTYQDVCKAGWAFTGGVKFNDIRDEYVHAYYDKMERDSTYDYRKCYNSTYDSFQEPNISDKSAFVKILHDAVGKVVTKDVWKEDPNMPSWKESPFYKVQNANPDSTEVQSAYADILKNGKILYEKENRLISLIKKENSRNRLSNDEEQECQELLNDLSYSHGDGRSDFVRPEHSDEWREHMRDKAYDPGLSEERLFYRIQDPEEVSHSVIVNDDIYSYRSYLAHHGIKGQKWGVRRFQKADGSLTAAGAKRYGIKGAMSAGRKVGSGLVKAARGGIQKVKEVKARKAAEKLERQKKVWAKTRLGLTMNADKFTVEELREANNRLDERDRAAKGLAEQVKRGVGYFQAIRDVTGAIKDTKDYIEDISGEKGKKAKAADELKYQRELEKEKRTYERDMVRDKVKADQEYEYKREKDRLDRESKEKIEKMKAKAKKKKDSGGSDPDSEPDEAPKKKASRENTTEFEDVYWNSPKKDREFMETVFPKEVDEAKERKKRRNKARREVDEAIRRMGFFGHSDISTYGAYLAHHGIKGQKWGVRRFQNEDGTLTKAGLRRQAKAEKFRSKELKRYTKNIDRATEHGQKSTKQMYEKLAKHLVQMTVDDIYKERRAVRTQAIGKAVLAGTATALASSFAGLPNIASIPMGVAMGKAASAGTRDQYRLRQIAHAVIFADDNALEHHGIKGQKWGVRRFQDEAGRLTSAGKKHAAALRDKVTSKLKINAKSIDFEAQGGGGGGSIDGWEDVSKEDEITLNDQKASLVLFLDRGMMSEEEVKELADAFGYELDDSLPMDVHLRRLSETITKTKGSDLKTAMFNFQQTQRKKVSYSDGIANGVSAVVNALFSSNLAAVADPVLFVKDVISAEVAKAKAEKRKQGEPIDEETGLHIKQDSDASMEEDLKNVNPGWKNLATNTKHNCMCCTATYDMRRRGYDVTANEVQFGYDYGDVTRWYPDAKVERLDTTKLERKYVHKSSEEIQTQYKQEVNEQLQKELVAQGDGARGNLMVSWDGGGGHSMAYEVVDGVAYIYDGQANMKLDTMNVVSVAHDIQYARLDNVDFDPEKIKEVVH